MTKEEFVKIATRGGYADKKSAEKYAKNCQREFFSDQDLMEVYRFAESQNDHHSHPGLVQSANTNGKTTAFSNGIRGNSSIHQDWI